MILRGYFVRKEFKKGTKVEFDKISKYRPAWIKIDGLPKGSRFISVRLEHHGRKDSRMQAYMTYLVAGLYLPIDYTPEEMSVFYDKFSEVYDGYINNYNLKASKFFISKIKKYAKKGEMLDLGAGTGIITERFVKEGYSPATLVDFSKGMIDIAKKRESLKGSRFIKSDLRQLRLKRKFDVVISFFSFANQSYFKKNDYEKILRMAKEHTKKGGIFAVFGHSDGSSFKKYFRPLENGTYVLDKKYECYAEYFIGRA